MYKHNEQNCYFFCLLQCNIMEAVNWQSHYSDREINFLVLYTLSSNLISFNFLIWVQEIMYHFCNEVDYSFFFNLNPSFSMSDIFSSRRNQQLPARLEKSWVLPGLDMPKIYCMSLHHS